ncbi:D-lyxose/D-mannose family sugar isomerase [Siculibacillus lacustris]|uniref:D-lyxose ketol-isomerase n=1 Tax=Siculibacillus lacustris TaxID=1549641 RepID=A0A4Q9VT79_9HYPH|nr:D-lyxose/D-mannose family sugar isomerase [Siculibacillus lacustris]TBW39262.1 D-lyxose/D-mannose family sugar isomerase [Siculibacillus lacustris]
MRRSHLNSLIRDGEAFIRSFGFHLPPFADWSVEDWRERSGGLERIVRPRLGWDITDFGRGEFLKTGLLLFTVRNGLPENLAKGGGMVYAEKIMISRRDQLTPLHHHKVKTEDIICRGGAPLAVRLFNLDADGGLDRTRPVRLACDGVMREVAAGGVVRLAPGESVTLEPGHVHAFWGDGGDTLIGEVSTVNDDETDNYFIEPVARFPTVDEDEPIHRPIVRDYAALGLGV